MSVILGFMVRSNSARSRSASKALQVQLALLGRLGECRVKTALTVQVGGFSMRKKSSALVVLCSLVTLVAGCEGVSTVIAPCSQNVEVSVGGGSVPIFLWTPACGMSQIDVSTVPATGGGQPVFVWSFHVPENEPVGPLVQYGKAPDRATVSVQPQPLVPGATYRVQVWQTVGGDVLTGSGEATFTHFPPD